MLVSRTSSSLWPPPLLSWSLRTFTLNLATENPPQARFRPPDAGQKKFNSRGQKGGESVFEPHFGEWIQFVG